MFKKKRGNNSINHYLRESKLSVRQKWADKVTRFAGSWLFILFLVILLFIWITLNVLRLKYEQIWDPYPFVFLNLILAMITGLLAPIILMSQNRAEDRDRHELERDYTLNKKSEKEIEQIQKELKTIKSLIKQRKGR